MGNEIKIHEVLPRLLKEKNMQAKQLARASGVAASTLSTWLLPGANPRADQAGAVAQALGVPLELLLFNKAPPISIEHFGFEEIKALSGIYRVRIEKATEPSGSKDPKEE